ncbi:carbohydrate ABC transporter substrate-binding protein, CUT1 family [Actinacidiphila yanglinensis]|uniref:Carbohydrate ABC transporter substrate-binding protein, CUT1 family n=1 Tax=Actinacidiphila yanglinensis TaxID=310779 RepID=A0A1H5SBS3_9ACTN|nr:ABC transporter substrate-binding protein [Actinacidiphila yanglinensis]SEF48032.1 carbohydrate ABC transporter substrate-binding protein, CUT1 family [Actinacidiphila yanglinensis]
MRRPSGRSYAVIGVCLAVLALAGVVVVRAVGSNGSLTLLANWTGGDETLFRENVIKPFEAKEHIHVLYEGSSAESQVLAADVETGTAPDIAVLPGPGELATYASQDQLTSLDGLFEAGDFYQPWAEEALGPDGKTAHHYWLPIKTDLKSSVWYPKDMTAAQRTAAAKDPASWCVGMVSGATSGWPGTDWIEDILLQQSGDKVYQDWATGKLSWTDQRVKRAWQTWGAMVGAGQEQYVRRSLTTPYAKASQNSKCTLEHQSSFIRTGERWSETAGSAFTPSSTLIPGARTDQQEWEVSADLAAMLHDTSQARAFLRYLARKDVQAKWGLAQSGFSADRQVEPSVYVTDPVTKSVADTLRASGVERCYDASDAMPAVMRDDFQLAATNYLADPATLNQQLATLDGVRTKQAKTLHWLPSVCGSN